MRGLHGKNQQPSTFTTGPEGGSCRRASKVEVLGHQLHAPQNADWDVGGGMQVQKRLISLASLLLAGGRHLISKL
jgi:hypothetical protein